MSNFERSVVALRTFADEHIECWSEVYLANPHLRARGVLFETFLLAPAEILAACGTRPVMIVARHGLLPRQRAAQARIDTEAALLELGERAIALLTESAVAMRSNEIAEALGVSQTWIAPCLKSHVGCGTLVACLVTAASGRQTYEYRIGAGGTTPGFREYKPKDTGKKTPPRPVPAEGATETPVKAKRAYKRSAPVRKVQRKAATSAKRKARKQTTRVALPAGGHLRIENAALRKSYADVPATAFRTAIASDGAMLFLGATAGQFELTRAESRALIEFVRTLDAGAAAA